MTEHAFQVLNLDMDDFFAKYVETFDQDDQDLISGRGETLQQYAAYQE
jgi:hypothetical protein